jgi:hypothetical protein
MTVSYREQSKGIEYFKIQIIQCVLSPYMSDVLKCPTNFWKKCPFMSDVLKCPTNFWKKCPYMSDVLKCPTNFWRKSPYMSDVLNYPPNFFLKKYPCMSACMKCPPNSYPIVFALHPPQTILLCPLTYLFTTYLFLYVRPIRNPLGYTRFLFLFFFWWWWWRWG